MFVVFLLFFRFFTLLFITFVYKLSLLNKVQIHIMRVRIS